MVRRIVEAQPREDMVPVYSAAWNAGARMFYWGALIVAVTAGLGGISAVITDGAEALPYAVVALVFAAGCLALRTQYNVEPVWVSRAGLWVRRDGELRAVPWARVGTPRPVLGVEGPIVVVALKVEGEKRPVRFVARRRDREVLHRERERAVHAAPQGPSTAGRGKGGFQVVEP